MSYMIPSTTFRLSPECLEMIDALRAKTGASRAVTIERTLASVKAPDQPGPENSRIRTARTALRLRHGLVE